MHYYGIRVTPENLKKVATLLQLDEMDKTDLLKGNVHLMHTGYKEHIIRGKGFKLVENKEDVYIVTAERKEYNLFQLTLSFADKYEQFLLEYGLVGQDFDLTDSDESSSSLFEA